MNNSVDNIDEIQCSICYCNTYNKCYNDEIKLDCGHIYHFNCIYEWYNINRQINERYIICPYCTNRSVLKYPNSYDGISLFYFFTKFKRYNCITPNCKNKEYPLNSKYCSKCNEPKYNKDDLFIIFSYLFDYHYLSLHFRKKLLIITLYYYQLYGNFNNIELQLYFIQRTERYDELILYIELLYEYCIKLYSQNLNFLEFPNI